MALADPPVPETVDEVVSVVCWRRSGEARGRRATRLREAEADFRRCCERHLPEHLTEEEQFLLSVERQIVPGTLVARLTDAAVLLRVLPAFLDESDHSGLDRQDRRIRIRMAGDILDFLARLPALRTRLGEGERAAVVVAIWSAQARLLTGR